jgi:transposase
VGVRAIRTRIECDRETLLALWRTHRVFNERLPSLITKLFAMRRGEVGETPEQKALYQRAARFILARDSKDAPYLLNSVSIKDWKPATALKMKATFRNQDGADHQVTGDTWATEAADLSGKGMLAFDKESERDGLPDSVFQPLTRDAVAYISGHDELVRNWEREHAEWLKKKEEWEGREDHKPYLTLRPRFEAFEQSVGGKASKRRERWHLYLSWLRENPDLAGWRGGPQVVNAIDAKAQARVAGAKSWKQRSVEAEEFWKANPELAALDKLHGFYRREFIRRRHTKRNKWKEGFKQRPTFTMPDPVLHPRWALFNAPQTSPQGYDDLKLPDLSGVGSVRLRLLTGDRGPHGWPEGWIAVRFRSDPRLSRFVTRTETRTIGRGRRKGETTATQTYRFVDAQLGGIERPARISGAKLILEDIRLNDDGSLKSATPYLVFACTIDDLPQTGRAREIQWSETGEVTKTGMKRKAKKLPSGLVTCAVDLGVRNLGFLTVAVAGDDPGDGIRVLRSRNLWLGETEDRGNHAGRWSAGPDLAHIGGHQREIKRLRRLRGKPVKGEESHVELQRHIDGMGKDRFKKAARAIVNIALNVEKAAGSKTGAVYPRADVLLLEKLAGFIPDAERERGINRALVAWNRGQLVTRIREVAADAGLKLFEVHPAGTSQCCSKCGALGRRYSIARDEKSRQPIIRFGWVEKLFACPNPECSGRDPRRPDRPFTCNSDHNASVNLHRRFVMDDKAVAAFFTWRNGGAADRERRLREIDATLRPDLEQLHGLRGAEPQTPF